MCPGEVVRCPVCGRKASVTGKTRAPGTVGLYRMFIGCKPCNLHAIRYTQDPNDMGDPEVRTAALKTWEECTLANPVVGRWRVATAD